MERICVYPGSFDPVTLGHEDVIRRAAKLFDRLIVAVMHNPQKTGCFPVQERMALLEKLTRDLPNVTIDCWDGLLVDYVRTHQASVVVRGLRAVSDFESELTMARPEHSCISSSAVREAAAFGADIRDFVPACIAEDVTTHFHRAQK